jgi:DNA polymerase elongation subunit (family B)
MGFAGSRWYCSTCLQVMYHLVRTKIQELIKKFEDFGYHIVYGDTDSCFVKFENINKLGTDVDKINATLPSDMHLELENIFKSAIFVKARGGDKAAKKKYAMLDYTGNLKIKGFEYVRRDWCNFVKTTQKKVLELILESQDSKQAVEFVKSRIVELQTKTISNDDLVIRSILHKNISNYKTSNPAVGAIEKVQDENYVFKNGDLVEYIITNKPTKSISSKAVIKEFVEEKDYDIDYYLKNQLIPAIHPILEVFGITKDELLNSKKQKGIKDFF